MFKKLISKGGNSMNIDFNQIIKNLERRAKSIYEDNERLKGLLNSTMKMIEENQQLKDVIQDITTMVQLIKDWIKGDYKDLSKNSIILIITALLYLVIPLDLIPDFLPMGFIDDIAVIAFVLNKISGEVDKYKIWKSISNKGSVEITLDLDDK